MRRMLTGFALAAVTGCSTAPMGDLDMGPGSVAITANTIFDPAFSPFRFAVRYLDKRAGSPRPSLSDQLFCLLIAHVSDEAQLGLKRHHRALRRDVGRAIIHDDGRETECPPDHGRLLPRNVRDLEETS